MTNTSNGLFRHYFMVHGGSRPHDMNLFLRKLRNKFCMKHTVVPREWCLSYFLFHRIFLDKKMHPVTVFLCSIPYVEKRKNVVERNIKLTNVQEYCCSILTNYFCVVSTLWIEKSWKNNVTTMLAFEFQIISWSSVK